MAEKKKSVKRQAKKETMKSNTSIVLKKGEIPDGFFRITERLDEECIIKEMTQGVVPDELVYHYTNDKGAEIWGLSITGVREAKKILAETQGIVFETSKPDIKIERDFVIAQVEVQMYEVNLQRLDDGTTQVVKVPRGNNWGVVMQPLKMKRKKKDKNGNVIKENGKPIYYEVPDEFAVQKAYSKALRNAILGMIPIQVQKTIIALAKKKKAVKNITPEEVQDVEFEVVEKEEEKPVAQEKKEIPNGKWKDEPASDAQLEVIRMMSSSSLVPETWKTRIAERLEEGLTKEEASEMIDALKKVMEKKKGKKNEENQL